MKYVKKPIEVEAYQYHGPNFSYAPLWIKEALVEGKIWTNDFIPKHECRIESLEGTMVCKAGSYIIKGVEGELWAVQESIFHKTYEAIDG